MKRRRLSIAARTAILERQVYTCGCGCGGDLRGQAVEWDHAIPLALTGADSIDNLQALLVACHRKKTKADVRRIAKARRQARYHETGRSRARRGPPLQGRGFTGWRKFNGEIVRHG